MRKRYALIVIVLATALVAPAAAQSASSGKQAIEIRSYNLKPGTRADFHRVVVAEAMPMLKRWKMDVVAFGPSPHDETSYYLIRAFADLADRQRREDAFYGSDEWRNGPRERILAPIESYTTVVLEMDDATVTRLRR
ncbi:MAG: NIPSNAP family protein [Vicinamibacterales bacterium]